MSCPLEVVELAWERKVSLEWRLYLRVRLRMRVRMRVRVRLKRGSSPCVWLAYSPDGTRNTGPGVNRLRRLTERGGGGFNGQATFSKKNNKI